jgi:hypothetical protein
LVLGIVVSEQQLAQLQEWNTGITVRGFIITIASASVALWILPLTANADEQYLPDANGCKVYDPNPQPDETVTWSGRCLDGYADGPGVVQWLLAGKPGSRFEGMLVRGKSEGQGSEVFQNGARFDGTFHEGERTGKGISTFPNGDRYEGDWLHDKHTGHGVQTRANGDRYEGEFADGKWSGKGTFTSSSGERYSGDWINNKREGKGEELWGDGSRYVGEFVNDKPADPKRITRQTYSTKETVTGSLIPKPVVTGIEVPIDKGYAQLTPEERRRVKSLYESMADGDEPPYPLHGPRQILEAAERLQKAMLVTGKLTLAVTVNSKGEPINVQSILSPDKQMTKIMAEVLLLQKYSPGSCKGVPCQMQYPLRIDFALR